MHRYTILIIFISCFTYIEVGARRAPKLLVFNIFFSNTGHQDNGLIFQCLRPSWYSRFPDFLISLTSRSNWMGLGKRLRPRLHWSPGQRLKLEVHRFNKVFAQLCLGLEKCKGLFINDVINFGGYRDPPPPPCHHSSLFGYPPSSRAELATKLISRQNTVCWVPDHSWWPFTTKIKHTGCFFG